MLHFENLSFKYFLFCTSYSVSMMFRVTDIITNAWGRDMFTLKIISIVLHSGGFLCH